MCQEFQLKHRKFDRFEILFPSRSLIIELHFSAVAGSNLAGPAHTHRTKAPVLLLVFKFSFFHLLQSSSYSAFTALVTFYTFFILQRDILTFSSPTWTKSNKFNHPKSLCSIFHANCLPVGSLCCIVSGWLPNRLLPIWTLFASLCITGAPAQKLLLN